MIEITLNGETRQITSELSLAGLVEQLGHSGRRIAIERNGEIVPRRLHGETLLQTGDRLEMVVAVGGG